MKQLTNSVLILMFLCLSATMANATVVITLDNVPDNIGQGQSWSEAGANMNMSGSFGVDNDNTDPDGVWLYPAMLTVNFGDIDSLSDMPVNIEIDVYDYTGIGALTAVLYDDEGFLAKTSNTTTSGLETLYLSGPAGANQILINGYESFIDEIRITPVPVPGAALLLGFGLLGLAGIKRGTGRG